MTTDPNQVLLINDAIKKGAANYRQLARTCLQWARKHRANGRPLNAARELAAAKEYRWAASCLLRPIDVRPSTTKRKLGIRLSR